MSVIKIKDDQGNWVPINQVIKPAPIPTLVNTATYNIPASGGDFWIDTIAAGASINATLPLSPVNNTIVSTQIVDNGTNDFYLTPTAPDVIAFSTAGLSGKYNGTTRNLIETLKYVSGRWLPYYGRLAYVLFIVEIGTSISLIYQSNGDTNGVFYWLGTNQLTTEWSNPFGKLVYSRQGTGSFDLFSTMTDRTVNSHPNNTWTETSPYIQVNLVSVKLIPTYVSVRSWINNDRLPRNFKIQASNDAVTWIDVLTVTNNTTITGNSQWLSLPITGVSTAYQYFRYTAFGSGDSNGVVEVALGEWEFYGVVQPIDIYESNTVFYALFEGTNDSTSFTDFKNNTISTRSGSPKISTAQSLYGRGSLYLDGAGSLTVPASSTFVPGLGEFEWRIAIRPTVFTAGDSQGLIDHRASGNATPEAINIRNQDGLGTIEHFNGATVTGLAKLKLNQWQILRISRYQGVKTMYLDDIPIYSAVDTVNYTYTGNLVIGDIVDTGVPFNGMFQGYMQYVLKTIGIYKSTGYGTNAQNYLKPPYTDLDPLEVFRVLHINCDSGAIVDTKGHVITPSGSVVVSSTQKRAGASSIEFLGGHLDIAGGTDFNFGTTPYSISLSPRLNVIGLSGGVSYPDNQYFCDFDSGNTSAIAYSSNGGFPTWRTVNANAVANSFIENPLANTWYDIALAKIDTKYLLIRNNQIIAVSNNAPTTANYSTMRLAKDRISGGAFMQGYLDSVSVYKGIANGSNLTHVYPLRFLARFSGSSSNDELGAVGTVVGTAPTYDTSSKRSLEASVLFPGTGYISYPSISNYNFRAGGFEIAGWTKASTSQNTNAAIAASGVSAATYDGQSWILYNNVSGLVSVAGRSTNGKLALFVNTVSSQNAILVSLTSINDNQPHYWRIIKYTIGSSAVTVMVVDGKIEDVYIGSYTIQTTTRTLSIGAETNAAGRIFTGNLDDIAIYTQFYYDGTNNQVISSDAALNRGTGDFLISGIFYITPGASTTERNIFKSPSGGTSNGLAIKADRRLSWWMDGIGELITGTPAQISEDVFHTFSISRSGTATTIRVDNTVYATITGNGQNYDFRGWTPGNGGFNSKFIGYISDLYITAAAVVGPTTTRYL